MISVSARGRSEYPESLATIWHSDPEPERYAVNVPLRDGITDASYKDIFESVSYSEKSIGSGY